MKKTKKQVTAPPPPSNEKMKALKVAVDKMEKDFGQGIIMTLDEKKEYDDDAIPTGSLGLDIAIGIGGLPRGRIIEIYGPESSGKTTIAMHVIAETQKKGGLAAIVDAEHAFDTTYAKNLGIDTEKLLISQPDYGEQALEVVDRLVTTGSVDIIVIDSVAALVPKNELEGQMGENKMGLHSRLMSQALRKLTAKCNKTRTTLIFINQLRDRIGVMFGNPETTTGGNALKFYASIRLDVRKLSTVKDGDESVANRVKVKVVKNKIARPFKTAEFDIKFGEGIDKLGEVLDASVGLGIILKNGAWYSYNTDKLGQGRDAVVELFKDNNELYEEIYNKLIIKIKENFFK